MKRQVYNQLETLKVKYEIQESIKKIIKYGSFHEMYVEGNFLEEISDQAIDLLPEALQVQGTNVVPHGFVDQYKLFINTWDTSQRRIIYPQLMEKFKRLILITNGYLNLKDVPCLMFMKFFLHLFGEEVVDADSLEILLQIENQQ